MTSGNFWQGGIVAGLNHDMHKLTGPGNGDNEKGQRNPKQDKQLTKGDIKKLEEAGWRAW